MLWSKLGVFLAVTLVLGTIACVLAFFGGQAIFSTKDVDESFSDPHVARAVFGCGLFLAAMGAFGLALGALLRNTAAAITTLTLPALRRAGDRRLPARRADQIGPYLPSSAGLTITVASADTGALSPWAGFGVLCAYVVATIAIAAVLLVRRDA